MIAAQARDPYTVLLKEKKLPMSLLEDPDKQAQVRQYVDIALLLPGCMTSTGGRRKHGIAWPPLSAIA